MTHSIKPMLLEEASLPFDNDGYIFEPKLDGWRAIAYLTKDKTALYSRNGRNIIFPKLAHFHKYTHKPCILDGEVISDDGFWSVRNGIGVKYIPFDILEIDGEDIKDKPLIERKKILDSNLYPLTSIFYIESDGKKLFDIAVSQNFEGIIAKRKNGKYYAGKRTAEWIKIKNSGYVRNN